MVVGKNRRSVIGKDVYVGIDVHKENWQVTVRTDGEEIFNGRIQGQYQSLKKLFERYQGCRRIKVRKVLFPGSGLYLLSLAALHTSR
jgi:hypothetical protein